VRSERGEMVRDVVLKVNCVEGTEGVESKSCESERVRW
jgi:hypothetical protein